MSEDISVGGRTVGDDYPPLVVAEIGMNHNGELELAKEMIEAAADAGADAVKFQTYRTERYFSAEYSDFAQRQEYELDGTSHEALQDVARSHDLLFMSTPFDRASVDLLEDLGVPCYKIASFDVTNHHLIRYVAEKGKPIIMSTGYSTHSEIAEAVEVVRETGNVELILLHCISEYPTPVENTNLRSLQTLRSSFDVSVGLSDHTKQSAVAPVAATAMGASVVEKHFTLDTDLPGYDHAMSETPETFDALTTQVRQAHEALGDGDISPTENETENLPGARRTLHWDGSYEAGTEITEEMTIPLRPGGGMAVGELEYIIGAELNREVEDRSKVRREQINWSQ